MNPNQVNAENAQHLRDTVYNYTRLQPSLDASEVLPITNKKTLQRRKAKFKVDPITYLLSDYQGHEIKGSVYAEELQIAKHPNVYLVEKIIRKQNGKAFVKWLGFGSEHNSWIPIEDIL
ncbi:uncharacterized protein LOC116345486 [Contarinia nasturtii]|uniref:uncharacterized protein LOC116345486 n=1 Tax=Contarinia nasturtii TaxID=265458 RepID=UPI0012D4C3B5|nr:uncharacterized protein LOC116345486 [Contarinia nasturtii]